jgi:hypothetical protein
MKSHCLRKEAIKGVWRSPISFQLIGFFVPSFRRATLKNYCIGQGFPLPARKSWCLRKEVVDAGTNSSRQERNCLQFQSAELLYDKGN